MLRCYRICICITSYVALARIELAHSSLNDRFTNYNLKHAQILDIDYLIDLTDNNAILLNDFSKQRELSEVQAEKITKKYDYLVQKVDSRKWQEWTSDNLANTFVK